ncbi:MAG: transposase family protein, partial [Propionibacteriaceae bacterium]|nr:transposase family protein [Propionibacteriaceae bacterium]
MKLSIFQQVVVALAYLRNNLTQEVLAERFDVSQPTISRIIEKLTGVIERALADWVPTGDDLDPRNSYIVDGTLVPAWSWNDHPEDYSGKHRTTGLNLQVACDMDGRLAWISDPLPGSTHDTKAIRESNILDKGGAAFVGDKGYIGLGMITPIKKHPGQIHLTDMDKTFNREIHEIRYVIEQVISHLKNWKILHTDYRRPHRT